MDEHFDADSLKLVDDTGKEFLGIIHDPYCPSYSRFFQETLGHQTCYRER